MMEQVGLSASCPGMPTGGPQTLEDQTQHQNISISCHVLRRVYGSQPEGVGLCSEPLYCGVDQVEADMIRNLTTVPHGTIVMPLGTMSNETIQPRLGPDRPCGTAVKEEEGNNRSSLASPGQQQRPGLQPYGSVLGPQRGGSVNRGQSPWSRVSDHRSVIRRVVGAAKQASLVCFDLQIIHHRKQEPLTTAVPRAERSSLSLSTAI
ncbi:unnamed protein product [Boreogadus saida]